MADRGGFEPPLHLRVNTLSKRAHSAALPSVLKFHHSKQAKTN